MIGYFIYLIMGSAIGWLVTVVARTTGRAYQLINIGLGILGAFLAGCLIPGAWLIDGITVRALLASLTGAVVLPAEINLLFGGRRR